MPSGSAITKQTPIDRQIIARENLTGPGFMLKNRAINPYAPPTRSNAIKIIAMPRHWSGILGNTIVATSVAIPMASVASSIPGDIFFTISTRSNIV